MKVREASKEPSVKIGDSGLTGKALVLEEDWVGYTCYAVFLDLVPTLTSVLHLERISITFTIVFLETYASNVTKEQM